MSLIGELKHDSIKLNTDTSLEGSSTCAFGGGLFATLQDVGKVGLSPILEFVPF